MRARPPILLLHGDHDEVVPVQALHESVAGLASAAVGVIWHVCEGMGHQIDQVGLDMGTDFLTAHLLGPGYPMSVSSLAASA